MINYEGQENLDPLIAALNRAHGFEPSGDPEYDLQRHITLGNFVVQQVDDIKLRNPEANRALQSA